MRAALWTTPSLRLRSVVTGTSQLPAPFEPNPTLLRPALPSHCPTESREGIFAPPCITGEWSLIPLLGVKIMHLVDRTDLFKISNLVYDGREIVMSLCSSLEKTERERDRLWWV